MKAIHVNHPLTPADLHSGNVYRIAWEKKPIIEEGLYTRLLFEHDGKQVVMNNCEVTVTEKEYGTFYEAEAYLDDTSFYWTKGSKK